MKTIVAYVRPEMLNDVTYALHETKGVQGTSTSQGQGFGAWRLNETNGELQREERNFLPHVRIEIVCSKENCEGIVKAVIASAGTGKAGDGVVFVTDVDVCYKIRTGESEEPL